MVFHLFSSSSLLQVSLLSSPPSFWFLPALTMAPKRKVPSTEVEISGPTSTRPKRSPKAPVEVAAEPKRYRPTFKVELVVDSEKDPSWVLDEPIADSEARTTWPERYQVIQVCSDLYIYSFFKLLKLMKFYIFCRRRKLYLYQRRKRKSKFSNPFASSGWLALEIYV